MNDFFNYLKSYPGFKWVMLIWLSALMIAYIFGSTIAVVIVAAGFLIDLGVTYWVYRKRNGW